MARTTPQDPDPRDEALWLNAAEKEAWTGLISLILLLPGRLEAPLRTVDLTLFEYLTLSQMSEAADRRIRMSELAYLTNGSLSRLSNVVRRFEQRGWVVRSADPTNGRYTIAALTDTGYQLVVAVRDFVLDPLSATDKRALARIAAKLRIRPSDLT
jgi:DNA-binding MarR family transcriptional regulator